MYQTCIIFFFFSHTGFDINQIFFFLIIKTDESSVWVKKLVADQEQRHT